MNEWTQCTSCGLKYREREDGLCPRCKQGADVYAGPVTTGTRAVPLRSRPAESEDEVHVGARIAGVLLIINGLLVAYEAFGMIPDTETTSFGSRSFIIDLVIGIALALGYGKLLLWAKIRVVLGAIIFTIIYISTGETFLAIFQLVLSVSLIGLLFGEPGKLRIAVSSVLFSAYAALTIVGIIMLETGSNPLARGLLELSGGAESIPADGIIRGVDFSYSLEAPGDRWFLRKAEAFKQENQLADNWLIWPEKDAHVLIIGEHLDVQFIDSDRLTDVVIDNVRLESKDIEVVDRSHLDVPFGSARMLHLKGTTEGLEIEYLIGVFTIDNLAFQVFGFSPANVFDSVENDLRQIITSIRFD